MQDSLGEMTQKGISFQQMPGYTRELSIRVKALLADEFHNAGLELKDLTVNSLSTTPEVQAALNKMTAEAASAAAAARRIELEMAAKAKGAATMAQSGGAAAYQQFAMGDAMVGMANRKGGGGGGNPIDSGVNLGMAMMMPQMMQSMGQGQIENMMLDMMPRMMDTCFSAMDSERREFMLTHCRSMLDQMEARYLTAPVG